MFKPNTIRTASTLLAIGVGLSACTSSGQQELGQAQPSESTTFDEPTTPAAPYTPTPYPRAANLEYPCDSSESNYGFCTELKARVDQQPNLDEKVGVLVVALCEAYVDNQEEIDRTGEVDVAANHVGDTVSAIYKINSDLYGWYPGKYTTGDEGRMMRGEVESIIPKAGQVCPDQIPDPHSAG